MDSSVPPLDLTQVREKGVQDPPDFKSLPKFAAGVSLARWVLCIIAAFLLLVLVGYFCESYRISILTDTCRAAVTSSGTNTPAIKDVILEIQAHRKAAHDQWMELLKTVLLNALLPVLTALLGYIFASSMKDTRET